MQPIHSAACSGRTDVIRALVEKCGIDPQEKADVRMINCTNINAHICSYVAMYVRVHIQ